MNGTEKLTQEEVALLCRLRVNRFLASVSDATPEYVAHVLKEGVGPQQARRAVRMMATARELLALYRRTQADTVSQQRICHV